MDKIDFSNFIPEHDYLQDIGKEPDAREVDLEATTAELNHAIKLLLDWVNHTGITIRRIETYSWCGGNYIDIHLGKHVHGEKAEIGRDFYLGAVASQQTWDMYRNDLELRQLIEEFDNFDEALIHKKERELNDD